MAYVGVSVLTVVQESQDAMQFKIWDMSTWGAGDIAATTSAKLAISYYDTDGVLQTFDDLEIIVGGVRTNFNLMLDHNVGLVINLTSLKVGGVATTLTRFPDGYYIVTSKYTDGSYGAGAEPHYHNNQAFLAYRRFMTRKMPAMILSWPMTDDVRKKNMDIFLSRMYLDAAEDAVDNGKTTEFKTFISLLDAVFTYYEVEEAW